MYGSAQVTNTDESVSGMNRPQPPSTGIPRFSQAEHSRGHSLTCQHLILVLQAHPRHLSSHPPLLLRYFLLRLGERIVARSRSRSRRLRCSGCRGGRGDVARIHSREGCALSGCRR